jgi:competence protein ComEC
MNFAAIGAVLIRVLIIVGTVSVSQSFYPFTPRIAFLDVGQGDSILIMPEPGYQILIDGGPGDFVLSKLGQYMPPWDMEIEVVALTHPHQDHVEGLVDVLGRYRVLNIIYNPVCYPSKTYENFEKLAKDDVSLLYKGKDEPVSRGDSWLLDALYPQQVDYRDCYTVSNINNASVVMYFQYKDLKVLLTGDAEIEQEEAMIKADLLVQADILKAGHHCSRTSSTEQFLDIVKPKLAICSTGKDNSYGHPHQETLERFRAHQIQYLDTAVEGDIVINL